MMPIFSGQSGSGKTRAISEFLKPINELAYFAPSMSVLDDTREATVFSKFYVIFLDEMARAERVNVEAMKNKITSETISYRKLGTNIACTVKNCATFIAATNMDIQDLIYDPKSARRFWQITSAPRCNWSVINQLNYLAMWQSVDEKADSNVKAYLEDILKIQENELRVKSTIELWLEEFRATQSFKPKRVNGNGSLKQQDTSTSERNDASTTDASVSGRNDVSASTRLGDTTTGRHGDTPIEEDETLNWLSVGFLYNDYLTWAKEQEYRSFYNRNTFGRHLTQLNIPKKRTKTGWCYVIDSAINIVNNVVPFKK